MMKDELLSSLCGKAKACKRALTHLQTIWFEVLWGGGKAKACKRALTHFSIPPFDNAGVRGKEKQKLVKEH